LEECDKRGLKITLKRENYIGCGAETQDSTLENQNGYIRECEEFEYLGVKLEKEIDKEIILRIELTKIEK
jgi:hypothetical protein